MTNEKPVDEGPILDEMLDRLDDGKRRLLRLALAGAAFTVPLMASFSMNTLAISPALAQDGNMTDNGNQVTEN